MLSSSGNHLMREIPSTIGNMTQLLLFGFDTNRLEGSIPLSLKYCKDLQALDLSQNKLNGTIPEFLMNLSSISICINMSHNSLTGMLPPEVGNLKNLARELLQWEYSFYESVDSLQYFDLSSNNLTGEVPRGGVLCNASAAEVYSNIKIFGGMSELRLHRCPMQGPEKPGKHTTLKLVLVIVIPALFTGLTFSAFTLLDKKIEAETFINFLLCLDASKNLIGSGTQSSPARSCQELHGLNAKSLRKFRQHNLVIVLTSCSSVDLAGQFSSIRVKGTTGYAAPEYGMSEQTSTCGDVYSFAILLLEMFTGRTPTNQLFKYDLNLHNFAKLTLPG
ncbi:leucine-rich repeat protein kinase family protein [Actinidia rufa]|uniref:Leucine-rich repeat protein kinase family protein n=1 Tax=Actinidia rufa TaxID=165716 RepID=A0A7J0F2R1_9ERIC|nr:leucine-rich repeat protein kinase family protein [Actinidia rufa]